MTEREIIGQQVEGSGGAYRAFLLRCWQEPGAGPGGRPAWRFTLVQLEGEGSQKGFASLESLTTFLREDLERGILNTDLGKR